MSRTRPPALSWRYALNRAGQALLVLAIAFTLASVLLAILPGDAIMARYANPELALSPDQIEAIRVQSGADRGWFVQYLTTLAGFVTGDFGYSVASGAAVSDLFAAAVPATLALAAAGLAAAVLAAVAIALLATFGRQRWLRAVFAAVPSLFTSVPAFWLGIVLIQVFSFQLGWVSVVDPSPAEALVLPALTLMVPLSAPLAQVLIRSIDEVRAQPFVRVTRAKGASDGWLLIHAIARNAALPALTMAGLTFGELVGGAVVTETVFGRTGIGQLTSQAVANRDNPVLLAVVVVSTAAFVLVNLAIDLLYPVIDVRLRASPGDRGAPGNQGGHSLRAASGQADAPATAPADRQEAGA